MINLFSPYIPRDVVESVTEALQDRNVTQGPKVEAFEEALCKKFKVPYAATMNSGTAALETAYDLLELKPGDEVISTPLTCTATNLPLLWRGVKIIWADILENTLCIDPDDVAKKVSHKTKAIVQVHLGGIEAKIPNVFDVPIVSDAAQALGIFTGDFTCCSFQAIKHITTVDGGALFCSSLFRHRTAKLIRWFGIDRDKRCRNPYLERKITNDIEVLGTKRHMNDVSAAMGIVALNYYDRVIQHRKELFDIYRKELSGVDGITLVDGNTNTYWLATVLVERRDDFANMLLSYDIDSNLVQIRNDIYKIFGGKRQDLPVMNKIESKYISLPLGMHVSKEEVHFITTKIKGGW